MLITSQSQFELGFVCSYHAAGCKEEELGCRLLPSQRRALVLLGIQEEKAIAPKERYRPLQNTAPLRTGEFLEGEREENNTVSQTSSPKSLQGCFSYFLAVSCAFYIKFE